MVAAKGRAANTLYDVHEKGVLILAVLILVVEGFFVYRWYDRYHEKSAPSEAVGSTSRDAGTADSGIGEGTTPEITAEEQQGEAAFVHQATSETIMDNSTYIDHPLADDNPDAILLVTQVWEPDEAVENASTVGVWYDANRGGRWAIFNQNLAPMPEGAPFTVVVLEEPSESAFAHRATPANAAGNVTYLDHPLTNGVPDAILSVTPNWNPGGGAGIYNDRPIDIRYDADEERWAITNQDLALMPEGAAFDVLAVSHGAPAAK